MRVLVLLHVPEENLGSLHNYFFTRNYKLKLTRLYLGDVLPNPTEFDWLVIMGGPMSVSDTASFPWLIAEKNLIQNTIESGLLVFGVCLGAQLIAEALGATIYKKTKEIGWYPVSSTPEAALSPFAEAFKSSFDVFHWHEETFTLPRGKTLLTSSALCEN